MRIIGRHQILTLATRDQGRNDTITFRQLHILQTIYIRHLIFAQRRFFHLAQLTERHKVAILIVRGDWQDDDHFLVSCQLEQLAQWLAFGGTRSLRDTMRGDLEDTSGRADT